MKDTIEAILFDMGGTLRTTTKREREEKREKVRTILGLLDTQADVSEFKKLLKARSKAYKKWAEETLIELNETDLWTRWMLPDFPAETVAAHAMQLNRLWREITGIRKPFPETRDVILELFRRGYRLGLVSNTVTSVEVPATLEELGISGCFETVILSCVVGIRKPDPAILLTATGQMGVRPERCVYVGDSPDRDVAGGRAAGFARTVILRNPRKPEKLTQHLEFPPDHVIDNLKELLDLFPPRARQDGYPGGYGSPRYDASLSTMWAKNNFPALDDFFLAAGKLGFERVELNHQMNSEMLGGVDLTNYKISSVHEPCPADISMDTLKERDWLISSPDEECRRQGVAAVKRSIDLAHRLSVRALVMHSGHVSRDLTEEKQLRKLFDAGQKTSAEYKELRMRMVEKRASLVGPCMDAVEKSVKELLEYAGQFGIRLGLENRYHFYDLPSQDELERLLSLAGEERIGFIYDVGHATAMDRLDFFPGEMWLKRFGKRIIGTHLHDVSGVKDHLAPGLGDVDFRMVASYLPKEAFRTLELLQTNTPEQIKAGLKILVDTGCVNLIN